eukprot:s1574_g2.t1
MGLALGVSIQSVEARSITSVGLEIGFVYFGQTSPRCAAFQCEGHVNHHQQFPDLHLDRLPHVLLGDGDSMGCSFICFLMRFAPTLSAIHFESAWPWH